jgi:NhaP-type Na+/H+ or K+/H+ antiporter
MLNLIGAALFGVVIGWITYRTLRRTKPNGLSDIATVIGAVGGATITGLFPKESGALGVYSIGLAVGFFVYLGVSVHFASRESQPVSEWLGEAPSVGSVKERPADGLNEVNLGR